MRTILIAPLIVIAAFSLLFSSCKKDEPLNLSDDIKNIVPDSTLNKIIALGMPINKGKNPPVLTNIYKATPLTLKASNVPNDYANGHVFADYKFQLYDQDNSKLTIKFDYLQGLSRGTGVGGFLSGNGNDFSLFIIARDYDSSGDSAEIISIISGTISTEGINGLNEAVFMLDNHGNPHNTYIKNETGRIFYDSDAVSPVVSSLQGKSAPVEQVELISSSMRRKTE